MDKKVSQVRWHRFSLPLEAASELNVTGRTGDLALGAVDHALLRVGVPVIDGVGTAKELAIELLKLAAEAEHALMVQYLYAAASVPDDLIQDSITGVQTNYFEKIMDIAIQEMGHLATVQNLLLLLGGPEAFYMQRDAIREASEKNPIPFVLEPINKISLAKYVTVEKPAQVRPELAEKVDELVRLAEQDAGVEIYRVGAIYEMLRWMFSPPDEPGNSLDYAKLAPLPNPPHLSEADLWSIDEVQQYEAQPLEWEVHEADIILAMPHTLNEASEAIKRIAEQGEGLSNCECSHFDEFLEVVEAFEAGPLQEVVRPIAKSPTLGSHGGIGGEEITHPYSRLWGEVFSLQYNLLVLTIYHALVTPRLSDGSLGIRIGLAELALQGMRRIIPLVSEIISSLPLNDSGIDTLAGPPYDLDPSILVSSVHTELLDQHLRICDQLELVYSNIETSPDFGAHPNHNIALANLRRFDKRRRELLNLPRV